MADRTRTIVLISDLGQRDPSVAQFKAATLEVNTNIHFVDVTHDIRPHDLLEAAFTIDRIFEDFPTRTIFAVMVDQYRGAPRRPILVTSMDYYYFAPDNGVLSFVYQRDPPSNVYLIQAEHYVKQPVNPLAHHRDVYGSAIGWLTKGIDSSAFGDPITDYVRTQLPTATRPAPNQLAGMALHVDRFGSLITNISASAINAVRKELGAQVGFQAVIGDRAIPVLGGWTEGGPDVFASYGPSGYLELVAPKGEAAQILGAKRGDAVAVRFGG